MTRSPYEVPFHTAPLFTHTSPPFYQVILIEVLALEQLENCREHLPMSQATDLLWREISVTVTRGFPESGLPGSRHSRQSRHLPEAHSCRNLPSLSALLFLISPLLSSHFSCSIFSLGLHSQSPLFNVKYLLRLLNQCLD